MPEPGVRHAVDAEGFVRIVFDTPGVKVNLLSTEALQYLSRLADELRVRGDVRGVVFASDKPGMFLPEDDAGLQYRYVVMPMHL